MKQDVSEESEQLKKFEYEWDKIKRKLSKFDWDCIINLSKDDSFNQTNQFKNNVVKTSLPILEKLIALENQMQERAVNMITFIATANTSVNSNDLYKLLIDEP